VPFLASKKVRNCNGNVHELVNGDRGDLAVVRVGAVDHVDGAARAVSVDAGAPRRWDETELVGQASARVVLNFANMTEVKTAQAEACATKCRAAVWPNDRMNGIVQCPIHIAQSSVGGRRCSPPAML